MYSRLIQHQLSSAHGPELSQGIQLTARVNWNKPSESVRYIPPHLASISTLTALDLSLCGMLKAVHSGDMPITASHD